MCEWLLGQLPQISTHTLTWSVTYVKTTFLADLVISTHTLTWSVTVYPIRLRCWLSYFNSHAHVERDVVFLPLVKTSQISTHTLTWSVTQARQS